LLHSCLREFELPADIRLNELSMGQKKKVFMSFALATNTRLLLLDEPTNGLDIPSKSQFRKVVANGMDRDRTIIISTHQVHDVEQLLDHIVVLNNKQVLLNASTADITSKFSFTYRLPTEMGSEPSDQSMVSSASSPGLALSLTPPSISTGSWLIRRLGLLNRGKS
jgi:ABC-2 type transport system ATP-binding protein